MSRCSCNTTNQDQLEDVLTDDTLDKVNKGNLFISLTKPNLSNSLVSEFPTGDDLLAALSCSCFLPVFSGTRVPYFRGQRYLDGGFSLNLPVFDASTVTVSPLAGKTKDIAPVDNVNNKVVRMAGEDMEMSVGNGKRLLRCLTAVSDKVLEEDYKTGFRDAERFLTERGFVG